jgi:hypothetical protein
MSGYLYCISNASMPGILKIGMTERTPQDRLNDANASDTWRPPTPYKIEFAKKVTNTRQRELTIHAFLADERIHPRREFFRMSIDKARLLFDLIDGEMWNGEEGQVVQVPEVRIQVPEVRVQVPEVRIQGPEIEEVKEEDDASSENSSVMSRVFANGQRIRHKIGGNNDKIWIGSYNSVADTISYEGNTYTSLSDFALKHIRVYNPDRLSVNGWTACEGEVDGQWILASVLRS